MFAALWRLLVLGLSLFAAPLLAQERVTVAYPGPLNASYLPLDLAPKIGADAAEGLQLVLRPTTGGGAATQQLQNRNVDFAVAGLPAAMSAKANGHDVVVASAINDLPVFVLSVRSDLKDQVRRPRDLAGKVIGVTSSSLTVKTISYQLAELLLASDGVPANQIHIVAAGQSFGELAAKLRSRSADAILGFEPAATRLAEAGLAYPLFNLGDPADAARVPGGGLLQACLQTRSDVLRDRPQRVEKMVAMLRRTLLWMAQHSPEETVNALGIADAETRDSLLKQLQRYPRLYSKDGKFSEAQLRETQLFYDAGKEQGRPVRVEEIIDARWAGRKP